MEVLYLWKFEDGISTWMWAVGHLSRTYIGQRMSWPSPTYAPTAKVVPRSLGAWRLTRSTRTRLYASRSFFRRRCIAQNIIGSAPGSLPLKAAIDGVVHHQLSRDEKCPRGLVSAGIYAHEA